MVGDFSPELRGEEVAGVPRLCAWYFQGPGLWSGDSAIISFMEVGNCLWDYNSGL